MKDIKEFVLLLDGDDVVLDKIEYYCKCYLGIFYNYLIVFEYF